MREHGWRVMTMKFPASRLALYPPSVNPAVILLVEDEAIVREVTREVLEHAGYRVLPCSGSEEALRTVTQYPEKIDLLLTDVIMPGMNGAELAQRLQNRQPDLAAVFMSGYAEGDVVHQLKRSSAIHIQKPFTVGLLLARITEALGAEEGSRSPAGLPGLSA